MAIKILSELTADAKVEIQSMRIDVLKAETTLHQIKEAAEQEIKKLQQKAEADFNAAKNDLQAKGQKLFEKLQATATALGVDIKTALFEMDKLYFYVNVEVDELKAAVKKVVKVGTAVKTDIADAVVAVEKVL